MIIFRRAASGRFAPANRLFLATSLTLLLPLASRADAPNVFAIRGARIVPVFGSEIPRGTIILRDGRIEAVGTEAQITIPADAAIIEGAGLVVYPAFVDAASSAGLVAPAEAAPPGGPAGFGQLPADLRRQLLAAQSAPAGPAGYGSIIGGVNPEVRAADLLRVGSGDWEARREAGIGSALLVPRTGFFAGTSAFALLSEGDASSALLRPDVATHLNLSGGSRFGAYPSSLMGAIALTRQTLLDARWNGLTAAAYAADPVGRTRPHPNRTSELLAPVLSGQQKLIFQANSAVEIPMALRLGREFNLKPIIKGGLEAAEVADALKAAQVDVLLGVNFPPRLTNPANITRQNAPTLQTLRRRANAPKNAGLLYAKGVRFALTSDGLTSVSDYLPNVRKAVAAGLPARAALEAMTLVPAQMLGVDRELGSLQVGKIANVLVADGDLMLEKTRLRNVFIDGRPVSLPALPAARPTPANSASATRTAGTTVRVEGSTTTTAPSTIPTVGSTTAITQPLTVTADSATAIAGYIAADLASKFTRLEAQPADLEAKPADLASQRADLEAQRADLASKLADLEAKRASLASQLAGLDTKSASSGAQITALRAQSASLDAQLTTLRAQAAITNARITTPTPAPKALEVGNGPVFPPAETVARTVLLRGATVWTSGPQGVLQNTDVLIQNGKIAAIGRGLSASGATIIDARGKHVTPGLIDCHSHTAIAGGVNEGTNSVTAEVRIGDVINPEDVGIYRQLAGGLTAANLLHGSANAIGGQNAVIKLRWGQDAAGLLMQSAPQGIKFALGENPTRRVGRFPNTRMGMEQLYRERFLAAMDYDRKWADFHSGKSKDEPRRDLQLEAISEVLSGKRLIHSHGYRQDEFLMLMRVCEEFGVHIRTFQHVLEGYKIADEMAKAGIGGSTFSDWWAFKVEAQDAIPYNGALMAERGVVVSFNSDDGDLARRLNLEAAKAVKYGNMAPSEALKFVTINPAKQLGIDAQTGSLEVGKDADVVLWSGDPLSVYSRCEDTWVEGVRRFSRQADLAQRVKVEAEQKALLEFEGVKPKAVTVAPTTPKTVAAPPTATPTQAAASMSMPPSRGASTLVQAIVGGTVHTVSGATIPDGVVVMQGTRILAVGPRATTVIPRGAQVIQAKGMHVSPGYIDAHTTLGLNEIESLPVTQDFREIGDFNPNVRAEIAVNPDSTLIPVARANGVLTAVTMPEGRLLAGNAALLRLQGWTWEDLALRRGLGMSLNFPEIGGQNRGGFGSRVNDLGESDETEFDRDDGSRALRGEAMAQAPAAPVTAPAVPTAAAQSPIPAAPAAPVAPQAVPAPPATTPGNPAPSDKSQPEGQQPATTEKREEADNAAEDTALEPLNRYFDEAERYRKSVRASGVGKAPLSDRDIKLAALLPVLEGREPLFVRASDAAQIRAALTWAKRRNLKMVLYADGEGVMDAAPALVAAGIPVVLGPTLSYPERADEAYDDNYTLPARLRAAGVKFALSSGGDASNVRRLPDQAAMAACFGLPRDAALRSITLDAAQILGVSSRLGSLEAGKDATLIVTSGDPLEITSQVRLAWIEGAPVDLTNKQLKLYERYRARPRKP